MPQPRRKQISIEATPYYHCVSRCVRRAFLCGRDAMTGKSFEHRRGWIERRLLYLSQVFKIQIASYAVMNNHYHVVLCVDTKGTLALSRVEVITRWHQLFHGNALSKAYVNQEPLDVAQKNALDLIVEQWRERLANISWFMRCMNESIARWANKEDACTGRFWEGRFKSQALLDDKALLACMAYVDLNPIRAGIASSSENSEYTSIKRRIECHHRNPCEGKINLREQLMPFFVKTGSDEAICLPFQLPDYLKLVEWTSKHILKEKTPSQREAKPHLLKSLSLESLNWLYMAQHFESRFKTVVGGVLILRSMRKKFGIKRVMGISSCARCFSSTS